MKTYTPEELEDKYFGKKGSEKTNLTKKNAYNNLYYTDFKPVQFYIYLFPFSHY